MKILCHHHAIVDHWPDVTDLVSAVGGTDRCEEPGCKNPGPHYKCDTHNEDKNREFKQDLAGSAVLQELAHRNVST